MTGRLVRLLPDPDIKRVINTLREEGIPIGVLDIRADRMIVHPPGEAPVAGNAYDRWKAKDKASAKPDKVRDEAAPRH